MSHFSNHNMKPCEHPHQVTFGDIHYTAEQINALLGMIPFKADRSEVPEMGKLSDANYVGHVVNESMLTNQPQPSWALVGSIKRARPFFYYVESFVPNGYQLGWNDLSEVLGTYDLTADKVSIFDFNLVTEYNVSRNHQNIQRAFSENWGLAKGYYPEYDEYQPYKVYQKGDYVNMPEYTEHTFIALCETSDAPFVVTSSSNEFTLEEALDIVPDEYRFPGIKITFANSETKKAETYYWLGGNWYSTERWIVPKGDNGLPPRLAVIGNKLHYSYDNENWVVCSDFIAHYFRIKDNKLQISPDNVNWENVSDYIAAYFRFNSTFEESNGATIGNIQISRDNKKWQNLSPEFINHLRISKYVATTSELPSSVPVGSMYGVGPMYREEDTGHTNPYYRIYAYDGEKWVDHGEFTSIAAGIVQEMGDSENAVMSQKAVSTKLSELGSYQGCIRLAGQGTTGTTGVIRGIAKGRTYRVIPQVPSWDTSGIPDTSLVFELYTKNEDGSGYVAHRRANNEASKKYYDITIQETTNLDRGLNIYLRAASGVECVFLVEDITDAFNEDATITTGVTSIKAISSFRPSNLVNGDVYYNSSYKMFVKITEEGYKEYKPTLNGLYVVDGIYYRWDGSELTPIDKKEVYGGVLPIATANQIILPSNGNYVNVVIPEGQELECNIKVKITGSAEYQVSLILADNSQKLVQNWTTASVSEIPCKIPSGTKSVLVYCSSSSNGTVEISVEAVVQPITKVAADAIYAKEEVGKKVDTMAIGYGYGTNYNVPSLWEQGHFRNDGTKGDSSAAYYQLKIRTGCLPSGIQDIKVKSGYNFVLFKYTKDGVFVSMTENNVGDSLDFDNYQYKMEISKTSHLPIDVSAYDNALLLANPINIGGGGSGSSETSIYNKDVNWGLCPTSFYECQQTDYSFGEQYNSSKRVIEMFDTLPMTKDNIGTASDGQIMYSYTLAATRPTITGTCSDAKKMPKIIIIAGQHGFEKNAMYATYYLMKDLCENTSKSEVLRWMRNNIDFVVIPCANPWGVDNYKYTNANNVNLNRNWGVENWAATITDKTSEQYQGEAAFDQPETRAMRDVILANKDASLIVDFHTQGGAIVTKGNINWLSLQNPSDNDSFYSRFRDVAIAHLINISSKFNIAYKDEIGGTADEICGRITSNSPGGTGYLESYAVEQGFFGLTFEGCNQFPNESVILSEKVKKANVELIGNYILIFATLISK